MTREQATQRRELSAATDEAGGAGWKRLRQQGTRADASSLDRPDAVRSNDPVLRRAEWLALVAALGLLAHSCKPKAKTDDRPEEDRDILFAEQERISKGEKLGEALRAPKLVVDAQSVTINGHRVAGRAELPSEAVRKVDPLFKWMKGLREHWKTLHPAEPFVPLADVTLPADLGFHQGASFLKTVAFSGYPDVMLTSGGEKLSLALWVPSPPNPEEIERPPERHLELCHANGWHVRYTYFIGDASSPNVWGPVEEGKVSPAPVRASLPWRDASAGDLGASMRELCGAGCSRISVGSADAGAAWAGAVAMIASAVRASARPAPLGFERCSVEPEAAPAPPPPPPKDAGRDGKSRIRVGAISVSGGLAPDAVSGVLALTEDAMRRCYAVGLAKNPTLQGRVAVRLVIDDNGIVSSLGNAGSDLPDYGVIGCSLQPFRVLRFPKPTSASVTVVQPYLFDPG